MKIYNNFSTIKVRDSTIIIVDFASSLFALPSRTFGQISKLWDIAWYRLQRWDYKGYVHQDEQSKGPGNSTTLSVQYSSNRSKFLQHCSSIQLPHGQALKKRQKFTDYSLLIVWTSLRESLPNASTPEQFSQDLRIPISKLLFGWRLVVFYITWPMQMVSNKQQTPNPLRTSQGFYSRGLSDVSYLFSSVCG